MTKFRKLNWLTCFSKGVVEPSGKNKTKAKFLSSIKRLKYKQTNFANCSCFKDRFHFLTSGKEKDAHIPLCNSPQSLHAKSSACPSLYKILMISGSNSFGY